jgi:hypothetical protein
MKKNVWISFALAALPLLGYPFVLVGALFWVAGVANLSTSAPSTREIVAVVLGSAMQLLALAYPVVLVISFFAARAALRAGHETKSLRLCFVPWLMLATILVLALLWAAIGG